MSSVDSFLDSKLEESDSDKDSKGGKPEYKPEVHFQSSEDMDQLEDESVHLIVTSPPYNADWLYGSHDDDMDYATEYLPLLARVFKECHRVLVPGGRMVVNVPSLLRGGAEGGQAIASDINVMMDTQAQGLMLRISGEQSDMADLRSNTDWVLREQIVWNKGFNTPGTAPNGSFPRPWGILLNNFHEVAMVYQKPGTRDYDDMPEDIIEDSKIDKWSDDLCDDVWDIKPEGYDFEYVDGENVPPFPEEFVKRCIALWSYKDDTVLDPFGGRGTTVKVAKDMKRNSVLYEKREELEKDIMEYTNAEQSGLGEW